MNEQTPTALPGQSRYDIVIAGGGMVGVSLACAIAQSPVASNLTILLVDNFPIKALAAQSKPSYHPSFDARSTALSAASLEIYQTLGILPDLMNHAEPIRQIHVSDKGHGGNTLLDAVEQGKEFFGCVVENPWLGSVLLNRMGDFSGVEVVTGASVGDIAPQANGVQVSVTRLDQDRRPSTAASDCSLVNASLLVVADGAQSGLRDSLGISASVKHYDQKAIIANVQTQLPHQGQAFERFTADGAVAFLPLPDLPDSKNRSALVWTLPASGGVADDFMALSDQDFGQQLQQAFGFRLGAIERVGQRQFYPLSLTIADEVYRQHIVVMGNAAHSLHPVAGQGFNLALRDVAALAQRILDAHKRGDSIGSLSLLQAYAEGQEADQNLTIGFSHNLIELFGLQALPVQLGRTLGLLALDIVKPAKQRFADQAAGLGGRKWL